MTATLLPKIQVFALYLCPLVRHSKLLEGKCLFGDGIMTCTC